MYLAGYLTWRPDLSFKFSVVFCFGVESRAKSVKLDYCMRNLDRWILILCKFSREILLNESWFKSLNTETFMFTIVINSKKKTCQSIDWLEKAPCMEAEWAP